MMRAMRRRSFLQSAGLLVLTTAGSVRAAPGVTVPIVASTWSSGVAANAEAMRILAAGGTPLDAAEAGVKTAEANPNDTSIGYGGMPNRDGVVQLDAAICDGDTLDAGSVAALEGIKHPVSVARRVLHDTPHVLLVGAGAKAFALDRGFPEENLLTPRAEAAWKEWRAQEERAAPHPANVGHDTIGLVARAANGSMAAACTTSGLAWKLPGRVGDSPLVGHGLYCDSKAGGAAATGVGEEVIKVAGSYQVVEFMRQGMDPSEAVARVIERIVARDPANATKMAAFVAVRADGVVGYGTMGTEFEVALTIGDAAELVKLKPTYPR